jgi:hypothetical protein
MVGGTSQQEEGEHESPEKDETDRSSIACTLNKLISIKIPRFEIFD